MAADQATQQDAQDESAGSTDEREADEQKPAAGDDGESKADDRDGEADGDADTGEPIYNDRDKLDFDPDEGFFTGTAVDGGTDIPGEHILVDDVPEEGDDSSSDDSGDDEKDDDEKAEQSSSE